MPEVDYYVEANLQPQCAKEILSPSGKFRLLIRHYGTKPGYWSYSRGTVYQGDQEVCDIKRDYHSFTHSFIVKNGQEWLITGRSYMSQTIVNLETGQIYEPPGDQFESHAFCWVEARLSPDERVLVVAGCHWACPYEFRFYDFSDPARGWPELKIENLPDDYVSEDSKWPSFVDDTIVCHQTKNEYQEEAKIILRLGGDPLSLTLLEHWQSDAEKERIRKAEIARKEYQEKEDRFKATDPLYLTFLERLKLVLPGQEKSGSRGITYKGWCPDFDKEETRWCRRILKNDAWTVDLEWGTETGPIKLVVYKAGNTFCDRYFEHSAHGMNKAFDWTRQLNCIGKICSKCKQIPHGGTACKCMEGPTV